MKPRLQSKISLIAIALTLMVFSAMAISRSNFTRQREIPLKNIQFIDSGDSAETIALKASRVVPTDRQLKWQKRELAAFVHFGINTFTGKEHGDGMEDPAIFNPVDFDARQWVRVFKEAGLRLVILTAKHHDGFCLWPTSTTEHSVKRSPWRQGKGDVVREVAEACREEGLDFGFYLSPWDRHEKTYGTPEYNRFFQAQLRELLTNYGPIAEVWFDGYCGEGPGGRKQVYDWNSYYRLIRSLQPGAVIAIMGPDVRWVGNESGLARESEWSVIPLKASEEVLARLRASQASIEEVFQPEDLIGEDLGSRRVIAGAKALFWYPAEVDVSIRPGWFYHESQNSQVKTPEELFEIYLKSVGRNSVLLLNIPADRRGLISESDIRSLRGWRLLLDRSFNEGYIPKVEVRASSERPGYEARHLLAKQPEVAWSPNTRGKPVSVEIFLKTETVFDCLELGEDISSGQRIEEFTLEAWKEGKWMEIARGTTVGYKRLLTFRPVIAGRVRLTILQSRDLFYLNRLNLYKLAVQTGKPGS
ncbi:MAG: alpha-L-fucosidase [Candidatus Saccharicenans sp.]|nr:alpha-L-fucosidase [Candidatus Saccharicenans sp.]